jgi:hypothetical protein
MTLYRWLVRPILFRFDAEATHRATVATCEMVGRSASILTCSGGTPAAKLREGLDAFMQKRRPGYDRFWREAAIQLNGSPKSAKSRHRKNAAPRAARLGGTRHVSVAVCKFAAVSFMRNQDSKAST